MGKQDRGRALVFRPVGGSWWWKPAGGGPSSERGPYDSSAEAKAASRARGLDPRVTRGAPRGPHATPSVVSQYFWRDHEMRAGAKWLCYAQLPSGFIVQGGGSRAVALAKVKRQVERLFPDADFSYRRMRHLG